MTTDQLQAKPKQEAKEHEAVRPGRVFVPDVDIYEDDAALYLWVDVPGARQDGISVELAEGVLTIEAQVALDDYKGLTPISTEYNVGPYARRFSLPRSQRYDQDNVSARLSEGVLEVKIPRLPDTKPRKIQVAVH
jgi:HSP20 family molecular chaperone IbpA